MVGQLGIKDLKRINNKPMLKTIHKITIFFVLGILALSIGAKFGTEVKEDSIALDQYIEQIIELQPKTGISTFYDYDLRREDQKCLPENFPCYSQVNDTAASRDYPRGTKLKVSRGDKSVIVKINDYGPMNCEDRIKNGYDTEETCVERIIDLSSYAFKKLADPKLGIIDVTIEEL
jgi:hypothetical protein